MKKCLLILCFLSLINFVSAQNPGKNFILGPVDKIESTILKETRTLNIYLPPGYNDSSASYPVIYLLDGSANEDFLHVTGVVQFLTMIGAMPNTIVVGIENVDRKRDFTFPTTITADKKDYPTTGGSEKFIKFIEEELQLHIKKRYRTTSKKTLIGQSLGGLLATEILLKKPFLFSDYLIVSPSLWWDNESLLAAAPKLLQQYADKKLNIVISVGGGEEEVMKNDAAKLAELLKSSSDKTLNPVYNPLPEEDHLTILHNAVYKGLMILNPPSKK
jgi:predicted alpha/beta superfamily hydrolase